jgi:creatinase
VTARALQRGDILSLNTFPMISGYYTALERTLFVGEVDDASRAIWEANVAAHELGMSLMKPGAVSCAEITARSTPSSRSATCCNTAPSATAIPSASCRTTTAARPGWKLREDIDTVLEPGMVISMEPMLTIPEGSPGRRLPRARHPGDHRGRRREHHRLPLRPGA